MFQHLNLRSFLWIVTLYAALIIGTIGCGREGDDWVGTWSLETVGDESWQQVLEYEYGEGFAESFSLLTNNWMFNSDGTLEVEFAIRLTGKIDGVDVLVNISGKFAGTYRLSDANYTFIISSGTVVATTPEGAETDTFTEEDADEDTGTWSRDGDTLRLSSDENEDLVFKKK